MSTCKCQDEGDKDAEIFVSKVKFGPAEGKKHSGHGCCGADCCWVLGGNSFHNTFRTLGLSIHQGICNVSWTPSTANVGPSS